MYKELNRYYNYRMSSLLYILDNTKHLEVEKCRKEDVLKFGGTHYCLDDEKGIVDKWCVNEDDISCD
jgi:hypothetical protein